MENEKEMAVDVEAEEIDLEALDARTKAVEMPVEAADAPKSAMEVLVEKNSTKILEALTARLNKEETSVGVTWGVPIIHVKLIFNEKVEFIFNINSITGEFAVASKSLDEKAPYAIMNSEILEYVLGTVHETSETIAA